MQKPWVTETHLSRIRKRDHLKKLARKKKINKSVFTEFRNKLTKDLRQAKSRYFEEQLERSANNIKKTWEVINSIIRTKKAYPKVTLNDEDGNEQDESQVANQFINYFTSIAEQLSSEIPNSQTDAKTYLKRKDMVQHTFFIAPIDQKEVNTVITDLKDNGNKVNTIATSVLVESKHIITPILCHLINLFVQQGYFPENLKIGCITPIFKSGDKKKTNNYRPVCSLSPLSKIIEKVINNRMVNYLEEHKILSETQFGFRKNMGTETALLNYIDHIQNKLNEKKCNLSLYGSQ